LLLRLLFAIVVAFLVAISEGSLPLRLLCVSDRRYSALPKRGVILSEAVREFANGAVEEPVLSLSMEPAFACAFSRPSKSNPQPTILQSLTTFFFKNSPKLACQAPKPPKPNKTSNISVAF